MAEKHDVDVVVSATDKASSVFDKLTKTGSLGFGALAQLGASAMRTITGGVSGFASSVVDLGKGFTAQMSEVAAISGATGADLQALEDTARSLGATTQFSAQEAAEGLTYMAMAGWKTEDMISGLPGILDLAAASGEDLGRTSDIVTDAMTAFGLKASESGHFADVLASASSNANTNVSMLGESFKYVAPVAGSLGYNVEDTSLALGLMANSGIKASQAGTALRTIMTNMAKPTDAMAGAMDALGLSLTDSQGNMKSLQDVMGDMRKSFAGLSEEQKASYAATIAGKEGMSGLLAIVNASAGDYDKLTQAIYGCDGAASDMAATMNDNLLGDMRKLNSAWEEFKLQIFEAVEPALRMIVQVVTNDVIPALTAFLDFIKSMNLGQFFSSIDWKPLLGIAGAAGAAVLAIKGFGFLKSFNPFSGFAKKGKSSFAQLGKGLGQLIGEASKGIGAGISNIEKGFGQMFKSMSQGISTMVKSFASVPITSVLSFAVVIGVLTAALIMLASCKDTIIPFLQGIADVLVSLVSGALQAVAQMLVTIAPIMQIMADALASLAPLVVAVGQAFGAMAPLLETAGVAIAAVVEAIGTAAATVIEALAPIAGIIADAFVDIVDIIGDTVARIIEAIAPYMPSLTEMVQATSEALQAVADCFSVLFENLSPIIDSLTGLVKGLGEAIADIFGGIGDVIESVGGAIKSVLEGVAGIIDSIGNAALHAGQGFEALGRGAAILAKVDGWGLAGTLTAIAGGMAAIGSQAGGIDKAGAGMLNLAKGVMMIQTLTGAPAALAASLEVLGPAAANAGSSLQSASGIIANAMRSIANAIKSGASQSASAAQILASQVTATLTSGFAKVSTIGATAMSKLTAGIRSGGSAAISAAQSVASSINSALSSAGSQAHWIGQNISLGLASGINSGMGSVRSAAAELAAIAEQAVRDKAKVKSPSRVMMSIGGYIGEGLALGIRSAKKEVDRASESLWSAPSYQIGQADGYGALSNDGQAAPVSLTISLAVDGREMGRATAKSTWAEIQRMDRLSVQLVGG